MKLNKDTAAHIIAFTIIIGFFAAIFTVLLGAIDIQDPVVVAFAGSIIGYCAGNVAPITKYYFGEKEESKNNKP